MCVNIYIYRLKVNYQGFEIMADEEQIGYRWETEYEKTW